MASSDHSPTSSLSFSMVSSAEGLAASLSLSNSQSFQSIHDSDVRNQSASDEEADDFILIPTGSTALQARVPASPSTPTPLRAIHTPRNTIYTPIVESDVESAEVDEEDGSDSDSDSEAGAEVRRRRLASDSDEDDEDITARTACLSLNPLVTSVRTSVHLRQSRPDSAATVSVVPSAPPVPQAPPATNPHVATMPTATSTTAAKQERRKRRKLDRLQAQRRQTSSSGTTAPDSSSDSRFSSIDYKDALALISTYLADPPQKPSPAVKLQFFQSLIVELGLLSGTPGVEMPSSCKAAKTLLKSQVHINIREYLDRRSAVSPLDNADARVWPTELSKLMYPSRAALIKSLKTKRSGPSGGRVPSKWAKRAGLDIFLITCFKR